MKSIRNIILGIIILAVLALISWRVAVSQNGLRDSDFFTFWLGGKLVMAGQNPFDPTVWKLGHDLAGSTWLENEIFCYPLPLAYLMIMIGALPVVWAGPVWLFLSGFSILAAILFIQSQKPLGLEIKHLFPVVLGLALFRPVLITIRNGQLGGLYLLIITLVLLFISKKRWYTTGIISSILYLKPTLGLPILGLLFIWLIRNHGIKAVTSNIIAAIAIFGVSIIHRPEWIKAFFSVGLRKGSDVFQATPTTWGVSGAVCGLNSECTQIVGSVIFGILVLLSIIVFWRFSSKWNIWLTGSIAIIVSLLITPYLWAYDQILLIIPILYITKVLSSLKYKYLIVSTIPIFFSIISLFLLYIAEISQHDVYSILLTLYTGLLLFLVESWKRKNDYGSEQV